MFLLSGLVAVVVVQIGRVMTTVLRGTSCRPLRAPAGTAARSVPCEGEGGLPSFCGRQCVKCNLFLVSLIACSSRVLCGMVWLYRRDSVAHTSLSIDQLDTYRYCYSLPPWCLGLEEVWTVRWGVELMLTRSQLTFNKEGESILTMTLSSTDSNIYFK